jgi:hypothetical protein
MLVLMVLYHGNEPLDPGPAHRQIGRSANHPFAKRPYPFLTASTISCRPCLASEKSIIVLSVS